MCEDLTELQLNVGLDIFLLWLYLLSAKTDVSKTIRNFISMVKCQFHTKVQKFRSDNGTEFMCMQSYFREKGIAHRHHAWARPNKTVVPRENTVIS